MTTLIKTLLLLGAIVLATAEPLAVMETDAEDIAIIQSRVKIQAGTCDCQATVYAQPNYRGHSIVIKEQNADFKNSFFDDKVDSIKISGTCSFIFYEDSNFNRAKWSNAQTNILRPGDYATPQAWGARGNMISSARALPPAGTNAIAIFEHPYYCGAMTVLYNSHEFLQDIEFDDKISSEIVFGGTWSLFEQRSFEGLSVTRATGKYPYEDDLMERITSIRKNPIPTPPPPPPPPPRRIISWKQKKR